MGQGFLLDVWKVNPSVHGLGLETVFLAGSPEESFVLQVVTIRMMNIIRH